MTRRVLLTIDEVIVGIANDMPSALEKAAAILSERMAADTFVNGEQDEDEFAFMEGAGAPLPPLMRALILASRNTSEFHLDTHELDEKTKKSRFVSKIDLLDEKIPAHMMFKALINTWGYSLHEHHYTNRVFNELNDSFVRTRNPEKLLLKLRSEQEAFGLPEGHPFRVIPDFSVGEDPKAILESIPADAAARLEQVIESIPWKNASPSI